MPKRPAPLVNIDQRQHRKGPVRVLGQTPVSRLGNASMTVEREKLMLYKGPYSALGGVDLFIALSQRHVAVSALVGEVACLGSALFGGEITSFWPR